MATSPVLLDQRLRAVHALLDRLEATLREPVTPELVTTLRKIRQEIDAALTLLQTSDS